MVQFEQNGIHMRCPSQRRELIEATIFSRYPKIKKRRVSNIGYPDPHVIVSFSENTNTENTANEILIEQENCKYMGIFILSVVFSV